MMHFQSYSACHVIEIFFANINWTQKKSSTWFRDVQIIPVRNPPFFLFTKLHWQFFCFQQKIVKWKCVQKPGNSQDRKSNLTYNGRKDFWFFENIFFGGSIVFIHILSFRRSRAVIHESCYDNSTRRYTILLGVDLHAIVFTCCLHHVLKTKKK